MLRLCLKSKARIQASTTRQLTNSLYNLQKANFSNNLLEEGEYIDGDFDFNTVGLNDMKDSSSSEFKKKFVSFEKFEQDLSRQSPKPATFYKEGISDSIESLKGKFGFELAPEDEFSQQQAQRKSQKGRQVVGSSKLQSDHKTKNSYKEQKEILNDIFNRKLKVDPSKNLVKFEFVGDTREAQRYHPNNIFMKNRAEKLKEENIKTLTEIEEYQQGEEGIDHIGTAEELNREMLNFHTEIVDEMATVYEVQPKSIVNQDRLREWRIRREHDERIFRPEEEAIPYPGSSKGPRPEDDPDYFVDWFYHNMSPNDKEFYTNLVEDMKSKRENLDAVETQSHGLEARVEANVPVHELPFTDPMKELIATRGEFAFHSKMNEEMGELALLPDSIEADYQNAQFYIEKWAIFRLYPMINNWSRILAKTVDDINNERLPVTEDYRIPSLYRYYNLLPDFVRNDPMIIDMTRCLEFHKHELTLKQKETALNYAAQFCLPMEPEYEEAMKESVISSKYHIPIWEEHEIIERETYDPNKKEQTLPGQKKKVAIPITLPENFNKFKETPRPEWAKDWIDWPERVKLDPYVPEENPFPVLPLEYYDNDDGFWNDYIAYKEQEISKFPLIFRRNNFKH